MLYLALGVLVILTLWLQFVLLAKPEVEQANEHEANFPDYYIENFSSFGVDEKGKQYQLEADRLVHYPQDNKSLLDRPHLTQWVEGGSPTHIYANSGWLFADGSEILLTDNVRVIRSQGNSLGGSAKTERMRVKLKPRKKQ